MGKLDTLLENFKNNGISNDPKNKQFKNVLNFQDIIGRSSLEELTNAFLAMNRNNRGLFLWVACSCLDKDNFLHILKTCVCDAIIYEEEAHLNDLYDKRVEALSEREKHMTNLEMENAVLKERVKHLEYVSKQRANKVIKLAEKAEAYDTIKNLLK